MSIGDGSILRAAISGALAGVVGKFGVTAASVPALTDAIAAKVAADPIVKNQTNAEPLIQSRVTVGIVLAAVSTLAGRLGIPVVSDFLTPDVVDAISTIGIALGLLMAALGRIRKQLAPLGGWNPLRWIGIVR